MQIILDELVSRSNVGRLKELSHVRVGEEQGEMVVIIDEAYTLGRTKARKGDHICMFANGWYQVFGVEAYGRLFFKNKNPLPVMSLQAKGKTRIPLKARKPKKI